MTATLKDSFDYDRLVWCIHDRARFAFVRYSDGEWNAMLGREGGVIGEHAYSRELGNKLYESMRPQPSEGYHIGIMPSLLTPERWWASKHAIQYMADNPNAEFCDSMLIHNAGMHGCMGDLFECLRGLRVALVGNSSMAKMRDWLGPFNLVEIPDAQCWDSRAEILPRIRKACKTCDVVLFACSMPAKVWMRQMWTEGHRASLVDIGSAWDPHVGKMSRGYMRRGFVVIEPMPKRIIRRKGDRR